MSDKNEHKRTDTLHKNKTTQHVILILETKGFLCLVDRLIEQQKALRLMSNINKKRFVLPLMEGSLIPVTRFRDLELFEVVLGQLVLQICLKMYIKCYVHCSFENENKLDCFFHIATNNLRLTKLQLLLIGNWLGIECYVASGWFHYAKVQQ